MERIRNKKRRKVAEKKRNGADGAAVKTNADGKDADRVEQIDKESGEGDTM